MEEATGMLRIPRAVFLHDLLPRLSPAQLQALRSTCRGLFELILNTQGRLHLHLRATDARRTSASAAWSLHMADLAPEVHLTLSSSWDPTLTAGASAEETFSSVVSQAAQLSGGALGKITKVYFEGIKLHALVPHWLYRVLPALTTVTLDHLCTLVTSTEDGSDKDNADEHNSTEDDSDADSLVDEPPCTSLTHLNLHLNPHPHAWDADNQRGWRAQLQPLPHLTHLHTDILPPPTTLAAWSRAAWEHLTTLSIPRLLEQLWPGSETVFLQRLWQWCPRLTSLLMEDSVVGDEVFAVLAMAQHLEHLSCAAVQLSHSHQHRACRLRRLTQRCPVQLASWGRLPLQKLECVEVVAGHDDEIQVGTSVQTVQWVVEQLQRMGGLRWALPDSVTASSMCSGGVGGTVDSASAGGTCGRDDSGDGGSQSQSHGAHVVAVRVTVTSYRVQPLVAALALFQNFDFVAKAPAPCRLYRVLVLECLEDYGLGHGYGSDESPLTRAQWPAVAEQLQRLPGPGEGLLRVWLKYWPLIAELCSQLSADKGGAVRVWESETGEVRDIQSVAVRASEG